MNGSLDRSSFIYDAGENVSESAGAFRELLTQLAKVLAGERRLLPDAGIIQKRVERLHETTAEKIDRFSDPFLMTI